MYMFESTLYTPYTPLYTPYTPLYTPYTSFLLHYVLKTNCEPEDDLK
jgi:hypothetical protein